jgi:hypothetical protein
MAKDTPPIQTIDDLKAYYMGNPEKHPFYKSEWKKFWNMRRSQLLAAGINVDTHDFVPEWIQYWWHLMTTYYLPLLDK